jgi:hypothetical protein
MLPERIVTLRKLANDATIECSDELTELLQAFESAQQEIADLKRGGVVVPENIAVVPHDGLLLIGSSKARQERRNVVGAYFDRLGNLQEIREGSLYDHQLQSLPRLARTIPADRVLGEGEEKILTKELALLRELAGYHMTTNLGISLALADLKALRAQPAQEPTTNETRTK